MVLTLLKLLPTWDSQDTTDWEQAGHQREQELGVTKSDVLQNTKSPTETRI